MATPTSPASPIYTVAIDQGTSSSRVIIYNHHLTPLVFHSVEFDIKKTQHHHAWAECDPFLILNTVEVCIQEALRKLGDKLKDSTRGWSDEANKRDIECNFMDRIRCIGVTNQRETTIVWSRKTGQPLGPAIFWFCQRSQPFCDAVIAQNGGDKNFLRHITGLPVNSYFSGLKMRWLIEAIPEVREAVESGDAMFGTVDTWLVYQLTAGGVYVTDVSNASRTMLMNLKTCHWDMEAITRLGLPANLIQCLPTIRSSSEIYGVVEIGPLKGIPISGIIGDQQSATLGQFCTHPGDVKSTFGTGAFLLMNTGDVIVDSPNGLLTTVCYQLGPSSPVKYALEGAVSVAGVAVKWLKDSIGMIKESSEITTLAESVSDSDGIIFVPAFSGLLVPFWRSDARGLIIGLSHSTTKAHIARATLEAVSYQIKEVVDVMIKDSGVSVTSLKVDGGLTQSSLFLQIQSDILGVSLHRPRDIETTARGAAIAAGLAARIQIWRSVDHAVEDATSHDGCIDCLNNDINDPKKSRFQSYNPSPQMTESMRNKGFSRWRRAVERSFDWVQNEEDL